ncbi:hypothetical protein, partial [Ilumatobacter sp.]|uniref:hypothetical protein n=1 Tax=Ilumatobacter sp. TaxID=1967498 RepID=UPI003AF56608
SDWADRLETHGLPDVDSDPLAVPTSLPPLPTGQPGRFELIWPSGEIDEDFDAGAPLESEHERDRDRAGPTARVVRSADVGEPDTRDDDTIELWDFETTGPSFGPVEEHPEPEVSVAPETTPTAEGDHHLTTITDDAVLSMRRAVETIEADSTVARTIRAADDSTTTDAIRDGELVLPGRVATRTESSVWSVRGFENSTNRSVFDETIPAVAPPPGRQTHEPATVTPLVPATAGAPGPTAEPGRVSALRRLIGGLRRR